MGKSNHTEEYVWTLISQAFSIWMVLLHFYMLWGIDKKAHAFPMWWNILQDENLMGKKRSCYEKNMRTNFPGSHHMMCLYFPVLWKIDGETRAYPIWWGIPQDANLIEKSTHSIWKHMRTKFPGCPHLMGFSAFPCYGSWLENPCISHMMEHSIGWESNGNKAPVPWEMYEYQFPLRWYLLNFPVLCEIDGETHVFPMLRIMP